MTNLINKGYVGILSSLKDKIRSAQIRASIFVNTQMIQLYWEIGRVISREQKKHKWGSKVVRRLSEDLQKEFPGMRGAITQECRLYEKNFMKNIKVLQFCHMLWQNYHGVITGSC